MERENQRIAITKRLMKESMLRLLKVKQLDKISITELCRDAGVNRATFYRHYKIPRDVLIEIEKDLYYELRREVEIPRSKEKIKDSIEDLCGFMERNAELLRIIIASNTDMDFAIFVKELNQEIWAEFGKTEIMKHMDPEDVQLSVLYCAGGSYFVLRHWVLGNIRKTAREMAEYIYQILNETDWETITRQLGLLS